MKQSTKLIQKLKQRDQERQLLISQRSIDILEVLKINKKICTIDKKKFGAPEFKFFVD